MTIRRRHHTPIVIAALALFAGTLPAHANYRQKAREQTDYIQAHFFDTAAKKYRDTDPVEPHGLPWTVMWANGVQWRVLVEAAKDDPAKYRPLLDAFRVGLGEYWDPRPKGSPPGFNAYCSGPGGNDKYYDDNAWMVLGFLEAYDLTHDTSYLEWAKATQAFVLSGWDTQLGGGIYWKLKHESKNTCSNAPTAVAALRLSALGDKEQHDWGRNIIDWVNTTLEDSDGLYWDNEQLDGTLGKTKWTYNTGLMIEADVLLYQTQHDGKALQQAERSADAAISTWQDPTTGAFTDNAEFTHLLCESLLRLYEADHDVRYLNAVRRHAAFGYRYVRDPMGGYWTDWTTGPHKPGERKSLIENASDARLFWLLAPYPDVEQLYDSGIKAAAAGDDARAEDLLSQASASDTEAVEARYRLWRVLLREQKTTEADAQQAALARLADNPTFRTRMEAVGWTQAVPKP